MKFEWCHSGFFAFCAKCLFFFKIGHWVATRSSVAALFAVFGLVWRTEIREMGSYCNNRLIFSLFVAIWWRFETRPSNLYLFLLHAEWRRPDKLAEPAHNQYFKWMLWNNEWAGHKIPDIWSLGGFPHWLIIQQWFYGRRNQRFLNANNELIVQTEGNNNNKK